MTDAYTANSTAVADALRRRGVAESKIVVIPNGVAVPAPLREAQRDRIRIGYRADSVELIGSFDVSVMLSPAEGFSNVVLESMASGIPLVTTDIPSNREAVEDGIHGLLVPLGDALQTADAIRRLLDDHELATRLAVAARRRAAERFSLEAQAAATMQLYDTIVAQKAVRL
jgi:glycosyltransferase involved in cell wall biosynthesis